MIAPVASVPITTLGQNRLELSRLGFGGVRLTTLPTEADALRILEHAFSRGITHFDVAPIYGLGRAEAILGKFLRGKRDRVTVTTKVGVAPPPVLGRSHLAIALAKRLLGPFPGLLRRAKSYVGSRAVQGAFTPRAVVESLQRSLRTLGTDHIELLLLHEATVSEASSPDLVQALEREVAKGSIGAFGIGSSFDKLRDRLATLPTAYRVLQTENSVAQRYVPASGSTPRGVITHSAFVPLRALAAMLRSDPARAASLSRQIGLDLLDPDTLPSLLLRFALDSNPGGVVLFASENASHVDRNVRCLTDPPLTPGQLEALGELATLAGVRASGDQTRPRPP